MLALLLIIALSFPPPLAMSDMSFQLQYAYIDGKLVAIEGNYTHSERITNLGNASVERSGEFIRISFNASVDAIRYFRVYGSYIRYEIRHVGGSRDVVFELSSYYISFETDHEISFNGTHISFMASSFDILISRYPKASKSIALLSIAISLALIATLRKLFPIKRK